MTPTETRTPHDPSRRPKPGRAVYAAIVTFYCLLFVALIWPVYPRFATIEPRVLSVPFGLAYVVLGLLLSFFVLLGLFLWEESHGLNDPDPEETE